MKMADGKLEVFKPDIGHGIYVKFQRNICISFASNNIAGRRGRWKNKDGGLEPEVDMK